MNPVEVHFEGTEPHPLVREMITQVATVDEERTAELKARPPERKDRRKWALQFLGGQLPPITEHDRAVMRMSWFVACGDCEAVFPTADPDPDDWRGRDHCPKCNNYFGSIRVRGQKGLIENPYLEAIIGLYKGVGVKKTPGLSSISAFTGREILADRFAWAIPDEQAISLVAKFGPILEIGAGRGYWAWLLSQLGVKVAAFDIEPPPNFYHSENEHVWHEVIRGGPEVAKQKQFRDHSLLLCWPPMSPMAFQSLKNFRGQHVIYIGEQGGGCTADDNFHSRLRRDWESIEAADIPQYNGIHDCVVVFKRK